LNSVRRHRLAKLDQTAQQQLAEAVQQTGYAAEIVRLLKDDRVTTI